MSRAISPLPRWWRDRSGSAGVELWLAMLVLVPAACGVAEVSRLMRAQALLSTATASMADMVAMQQTVTTQAAGTGTTNASLPDMCNGALIAMLPFAASSKSYSTPNVSVAVTSVTQIATTDAVARTAKGRKGKNGPKGSSPTSTLWQDWEVDAPCGNSGAAGFSTPLNTADPYLSADTDSVILVQMSYTYTPVLSTLFQARTLTQTAFARPRLNTTVNCVNSSGSAC